MSAPEQTSGGGALASILALPNDSRKKTIFMALAVCFSCSVIVASAAVGLRPLQIANQNADRIRNIVSVAGVAQPGDDIMAAFKQIEASVIRLSDGTVSTEHEASSFDIARAARDPNLSRALSRAEDGASIGRIPNYMPIFIVRDDEGQVKTLVLPVHGAGLWSTLFGFLALEGDLKTAQGLKFYQHAETPGLGGEIDNPNWRAQWAGKVMFNEQWQPSVQLVKGSVDSSNPAAMHMIDGLAGATLTTRGVQDLINFWLGDTGYGPLLARLRNERG